jgi:hypothetical protein
MNNSGNVAASITGLLTEAAERIAPQYRAMLLELAYELAERHPNEPERRTGRPALALVGGSGAAQLRR